MNIFGLTFEIWVVALGAWVLVRTSGCPPAHKWRLGYAAAWVLFIMLLITWRTSTNVALLSFSPDLRDRRAGAVLQTILLHRRHLVLTMTVGFEEKLGTGLAEYCALTLFALAGMMLASSANHFACCSSRSNASRHVLRAG